MSNTPLQQARNNKEDEFYTQLNDISKELRHYKNHFKDKVVFCNCDDPFESNFVKYFALNFNYLGLKKLIATCYVDSPVAWGQLSLFDVNTFEESPSSERIPYKIEITEVQDYNKDGATDILDIEYLLKNHKNTLTILKGDGDFRSKESVELLKESDIVVTNPPFSLFREYVQQLMDYDKQFIIIGNQNNVNYQDIFPLFMDNKIWLGNHYGDMSFRVPNKEEYKRDTRFWIDENGDYWRSLGTICWYTNLDFAKRHEKMILYKNYSNEEYPKFDNYNAIEVSKTNEIPYDYDGIMGVPITFMNKYNADQFELLGLTKTPICHSNKEEAKRIKTYVGAKQVNKNGSISAGGKVNDGATLLVKEKPFNKVYYTAENTEGYLQSVYVRVLIKKKVGSENEG